MKSFLRRSVWWNQGIEFLRSVRTPEFKNSFRNHYAKLNLESTIGRPINNLENRRLDTRIGVQYFGSKSVPGETILAKAPGIIDGGLQLRGVIEADFQSRITQKYGESFEDLGRIKKLSPGVASERVKSYRQGLNSKQFLQLSGDFIEIGSKEMLPGIAERYLGVDKDVAKSALSSAINIPKAAAKASKDYSKFQWYYKWQVALNGSASLCCW